MRQIALLYTVVLTKERRIRSAELIEIAIRAGCRNARTVLSTGNLIFDRGGDEGEAEAALEHALRDMLGKPIPVFVRGDADWHDLVGANPFPAETAIDPARVAVRVMRIHPDPAALLRIESCVGPQERFAARYRALWLASTAQLSTSPLLRAVASPRVGDGTLRSASALAKITAALGD
jgi:uncharacterized protein (DUF1697 family)